MESACYCQATSSIGLIATISKAEAEAEGTRVKRKRKGGASIRASYPPVRGRRKGREGRGRGAKPGVISD